MPQIPFDPDNLSTLVLCTLCARCHQATATTRRTSGQWVCDAPLCRGVVTVEDIDWESDVRYRVLLDGVSVPASAVNEDEGWVEYFAFNADGTPQMRPMVPEMGDVVPELVRERHYGVVQIIPYHLKSASPHGKSGDKPLQSWNPGNLTIHAAESL